MPEVDLLLRPPCVKNLHLHLECANYAASIYTELKYSTMLLNLLTEYGGEDSGGNIKWAKECFLEGVTNMIKVMKILSVLGTMTIMRMTVVLRKSMKQKNFEIMNMDIKNTRSFGKFRTFVSLYSS